MELKIGKTYIIKDGQGNKRTMVLTVLPDERNPNEPVAGFGNKNFPVWRKVSEIEDYEERVQYLKDLIQRKNDQKNFNGITEKDRLLVIAANVELIGYGLKFEPDYNCPN